MIARTWRSRAEVDRGSAFYRDPDAALGPLWQRLNELSIQPTTLHRDQPGTETAVTAIVAGSGDGGPRDAELVLADLVTPLDLDIDALERELANARPASSEHDRDYPERAMEPTPSSPGEVGKMPASAGVERSQPDQPAAQQPELDPAPSAAGTDIDADELMKELEPFFDEPGRDSAIESVHGTDAVEHAERLSAGTAGQAPQIHRFAGCWHHW